MKKSNTMSLAFLAIGLLVLSSGMAFATTQIGLQGNDSNVTTTPNVTATPYVTVTPYTNTATPSINVTTPKVITAQPTDTEMVIPTEVVPTEVATPMPASKSPGFEIVIAIFVLSAIYILGRRR